MHARSAQRAVRPHSSGQAFVFSANDCQLKNETVPNLEFFNTIGRVEMWRGGLRYSLAVAAPFVWRCLNS